MSKLMAKYQILLPDDIDEIEWLIEAKGCFRLDVEIETEIYEFNFYDSVRLIQTMNDCLDCNTYFFEQNLVILPMVLKYFKLNELPFCIFIYFQNHCFRCFFTPIT